MTASERVWMSLTCIAGLEWVLQVNGTFCGWVWMSFIECNSFLSWVYVGLSVFCLLDVGKCNFYLAEFEWVWTSRNFFGLMWVGNTVQKSSF